MQYFFQYLEHGDSMYLGVEKRVFMH